MIEVTLEWANTYFENRPNSSQWISAADDSKKGSLTMAGYIIDGAFRWNHRAYTVTNNVKTWNENVLASICEQAIWILKRDITDYPEELMKGIKSADAGEGISVEFSKNFICPYLCPYSEILVSHLGVKKSDISGELETYNLARW